ncbi:uncharacterized protein SPPG_03047 [Spizellomyces punctatus DAOM BR117]|uniref:Uncharacterized protein n=1 Tax=Spizellomyces punctatus (strain DAOM BR117) TaxID=645134 RepID=A0A0L0HNS6_SPIPD|nr:uncharacterized protein SPPG_03047 [Spizellomyces punctatus DAOM BR117]KND02590.1 hypothetical protein SPPG_03047 [Spizellomyces punctatus DAOM BR117]|eukprot:XP_016610629.1 hypothetical protein SPPG_03047 [Spizellomyces punctatus DAOM BR117]
MDSKPSCEQTPTVLYKEPKARHHKLYWRIALAVAAVFVISCVHQFQFETNSAFPTKCPLNPPPPTTRFIENRARLHHVLGVAVPSYGDSNATLIAIPTGSRPGRDNSDMEMVAWRPSGNVMYIMGEFSVSDALLVLEANADKSDLEVTVFFPNQTQRELVFSGGFPDDTILRNEFGVLRAKKMSEFASYVRNRTVITTSKHGVARALGRVPEGTSIVESEELKGALQEARFVKSQDELEAIAYASRVARWVHGEMEKSIRNSKHLNEITLASLFAHLSSLCGSRLQAYSPIVGAGRHASILHYRTGENETTGYASIDSPNFVLIDAAGEYQGYASDMTRTYPRRGKWSKKMTLVHAIVEKTQRKAIETYELGVELAEINKVATRTLLKELVQHRFFKEGVDIEELVNERADYIFMPHGLGHPVGLDVHDPTPQVHRLMTASSLVSGGYPASLPWFVTLSDPPANYKIFPGHVMTIEPGVYFIPELWKQIKQDTEGIGRFVNWDRVEEFVDVGGVRIEDVVMIDRHGKKRIVTRE